MQTTASPREWQRVLPEGTTIRTLIMKIRMGGVDSADRRGQHADLHACSRETAEVLVAQRIGRHSLLDDNPCSG